MGDGQKMFREMVTSKNRIAEMEAERKLVEARNAADNARLRALVEEMAEALKDIHDLTPGGPHVSAKSGFEAALNVVGNARLIASNALTKYRAWKEGQ